MARPARRPGRQAQVARLLLTVALVAACANVGDPPGGPPDTAPPVIVRVQPESGAVIPGWKDDAIIQFDEVIDEMAGGGAGGGVGGLAAQVLLSPVTRGVKVSWRRTSISVKPREGWKRGRVYRLELLPGILDLRRNRLDSGRVVLFSTGPEIGHARIGGVALQWVEQRIIPRALIEAVPLPDSVGYLVLADSGGQFDIPSLAPGRYIVYATADANTNRHRDLREAYDSALVTLDSSANVALFAFVHDSVGPRPREVTAVDSLAIAMTFSQPLSGSTPLDSTRVQVLELPDSTPVPVAAVLSQRQYDSIAALQRVQRDTADTGAVARPGDARRIAAPAPVRVDTALVRGLLAQRFVPTDKIVLRLARAMKPETRYLIRVRGATNLNGAAANGQLVLLMPKPVAADTTRRAPPPAPRPPIPKPPND